jgi:hypothetical protein
MAYMLILNARGGEPMKSIDVLDAPYVGIDAGSQTNSAYAADFSENNNFKCSVGSKHPGAVELAQKIAGFMKGKQLADWQ